MERLNEAFFLYDGGMAMMMEMMMEVMEMVMGDDNEMKEEGESEMKEGTVRLK